MIPGWPSASESVGIVTGLEGEARIARRLGWPVAVGGGTAEGARAAARRLADQGATALVSFGLAGGLDPTLRPGALLVPEAVRVAGASRPTDPDLSRTLGGPTPHSLLGADAPAVTAADKRRLWNEAHCAAIDLESGSVAEVALALSLRFAVLRAVCDPADMALPAAALVALTSRGRIGPVRLLASVARAPGQIPALLRLAASATRARRALAHRVATIRAATNLRPVS